MKRRFREATAAEREELDRIEALVMEEYPPATETQRLAARLRRSREEAGVTLVALSQRTGIAEAELAGIESGDVEPSLETVSRYAAGLEMRLKLELVGRTSDSASPQSNRG
jgi:ribosome-binding protein aMBF1 (putative translation factor)